MRVYEAWEMGYSGAGIRIAVLDDGLEIGHPDLMDNYVSSLCIMFIIPKMRTDRQTV